MTLSSWNPILFRGSLGHIFRHDALPDLERFLDRLTEQDAALSDIPIDGVSERLAVFDAVAHFITVLPEIGRVTGQLQSDLLQLDGLLRIISLQNLDNVNDDDDDNNNKNNSSSSSSSAELTMLSRTQRAAAGRVRALRRAALRELSHLRNPRLVRMVRIWLNILATRQHLAPELRDAQNVVILTELIQRLRGQKLGVTGTAQGRAAELKIRDRIRELARGNQAARDQLRREFDNEELADLGV